MMPRLLTYKTPKQLPQRLIYKMPLGDTKVYKMADTQTGKCVGQMIGNMTQEYMGSLFYPTLSSYKSFFIRILLIKNKGQGHGTSFIKFAQNESRKNGGQGRVHLIASNRFTPKTPPQVFYRKLGFTSRYEEPLKDIDTAIKKRKNLEEEYAVDLPMYLPTETSINTNTTSKTQKKSFWTRIKNLFK